MPYRLKSGTESEPHKQKYAKHVELRNTEDLWRSGFVKVSMAEGGRRLRKRVLKKQKKKRFL
jgi:hypothetical protein